jgi:predicted XRE-type DNA-binding protein
MKRKEDIEVIRGSGNVFRDLKRPDADVKQLKGILAAEIIKMLDRDKLTVRAAQTRTGVAAADFSRIRNANLARFTVDRLMAIINRLGSSVEVAVKVRRSIPRGEHATSSA